MIARFRSFTAFAATLLGLVVATGVSTPRPRTPGRERAVRSIAVAGSTRSQEAWVSGVPDDDGPDLAVADGDALATRLRLTFGQPVHGLPAPPPAVGRDDASRIVVPAPPLERHGHGEAKPARGRAPPASRS